MTFLSILSFLLVAVYCLYTLRSRIRMTINRWRKRTVNWVTKLGTSGVEANGSKLSDFIGLGGFSVSLLAIILGWYSIVLQTRKNALEQEGRDLAAKVVDKQQQIDTSLNSLKASEPNEPLHLETPGRDAQLIGKHVDLEWNYSGHSPFLTYVIEVTNKKQSGLMEFDGEKRESCLLTRYRTCAFMASDPAGQHSQVFSEQVGGLAGSYLWRVAPAQRTSAGEDNFDSDRVSDWSQYRAFTIFSTIRSRIMTSKSISVGTTYAEDIRFSTLGGAGQAEGFDIDLVKILVEGCLTADFDSQRIDFDRAACHESVADYLRMGRYERKVRFGQLKISVKPFTSIGAGLDALGRREVDLFIGSLTKAKKREHGPILFTDGYFPFETKLYVRSETGERDLVQWAQKKQKVGVISKSSNYWLATLLERETPLENQLTVVTFDTYPALEAAFDRGEVGGALLDDVLGGQLHDATALDGLRQTTAWSRYHEDEDSLGFPQEEFSIAVVLDLDDRLDENRLGILSRLKHFFAPHNDDFVAPNSLHSQLQRALRSDDVRVRLLPKLRDRFIDHSDRKDAGST